jgi:hypothetical protein
MVIIRAAKQEDKSPKINTNKIKQQQQTKIKYN